MRTLVLALLLTAPVAALAADKTPPAKADAKADAQKEVTLSGQIGCGHCTFGVTDSCADAIRVKENGKDVVYLFAADPSRKHDESVCDKPREGSVTGTVTEKDGKKLIKVAKIDFKK